MFRVLPTSRWALVCAACLCGGNVIAQQASDELVEALSFTPRQSDVRYEKVDESQFASCQIEKVRRTDGFGFWVTGPAGQPLRWFADTNADNKLDRWSFFNQGVEVYRESDTDGNRKADEYRWLSTEGIRRGKDADEDGVIDSWSIISAEEVTAEVVQAVASRDAGRFARLLISKDELDSLGLGEEKREKLAERVALARQQFDDWATSQTVVTRNSRWTNFGADKPGVVPAGTDGSEQDVVVYENVVALLEEGGDRKQLLVGTMVQVGNTWRLVDLPRAVTEGAVLSDAGMFFAASFSSRGAGADAIAPTSGGISEVMQRLVSDLEKVDSQLVAGEGDLETLHDQRAAVLEKLVAETADPTERSTWIRQLADTVNAAAQAGEYKGGVERLQAFARRLGATEDVSTNDVAYVVYRGLEARHQRNVTTAKESEWETVQKDYMSSLEKFAEAYPDSPEAADAMINIALASEFSGDIDDAKDWYSRASKSLGGSLAGRKAAGALRRLGLEGQPFMVSGKTIDGRDFNSRALVGGPVIYHCWSSWSSESKSEMATLKQLQSKYSKQKLRIVGINFDVSARDLQARDAFLAKQSYPWLHLEQVDGLDSEIAVNYGILSLPMNIVVDPSGKVAKAGIYTLEIDGLLDTMLKK